MKRGVIVKTLASVAVIGLLALYLLKVISVSVFLPLIVIVFLCLWLFNPNSKE